MNTIWAFLELAAGIFQLLKLKVLWLLPPAWVEMPDRRLIARVLPPGGQGMIVRYAPNGKEHEVLLKGVTGPIVEVSADGKLAAAAVREPGDSTLQSIRVWSLESKEVIHTYGSHCAQVIGLAFSSDNKLLASGSNAGDIKIWDLAATRE